MVMYYLHREDGHVKFKEEPPPTKIRKFGRAPVVIQDSIEPYYHPRAEMMIDSRSKLNAVDKACNTITTDKFQKPDPTEQMRKNRERKEDCTKALLKSVAMIDSGNAPLSEETRELCKKQNEIIASAMPGLDPWNAVGRKNNPKGKRYKKN